MWWNRLIQFFGAGSLTIDVSDLLEVYIRVSQFWKPYTGRSFDHDHSIAPHSPHTASPTSRGA